jgi:RNA polymerase sigma factor (sigma-70 family)
MTDNKKLKEIYMAYYKSMFNYAKKYMSEADAEDVVQNVFLKLISNFNWLTQIMSVSDNIERVRAILFIFVQNECKNFNRYVKITNKIFVDNVPYLESENFTNPEQEYQNADILALLMTEFNKLNRSIFIKYYIEGYSMKELVYLGNVYRRI